VLIIVLLLLNSHKSNPSTAKDHCTDEDEELIVLGADLGNQAIRPVVETTNSAITMMISLRLTHSGIAAMIAPF
jgi:hypothetical protein